MGVQLEVLRLRAATGPSRHALVLLHEGLGSVAMWRDWPSRLARESGREVIVYSRQGYGRSDPVADVRGTGRRQPDYMHYEAWVVLPALLERLRVSQPVLLGHSDGASIALLHASRHPVLACIAMAPHVMVEEVSIRSIEQARDAWLHDDLRARLARHHNDVDGAFWGWNDAWLNPEFRTFDIREDCRSIDCPVLALQGEQDAYGTAQQIEQIHTRATVTRHMLPTCGHSPHRDQVDATTNLITDFLQTLP